MKKALAVFLFLILSGIAYSQAKTHKVQPKETVWGISKQYGVTQEQLVEANPFLKDRVLQAGDVLTIPGKTEDQPKEPVKEPIKETPEKTKPIASQEGDVFIPTEDKNFIYLKIKAKQTIYSLTKDYQVSEETLRSLNPQLAKGLKAGDIIRIPKKEVDNQQAEITPEGMYKVKKSDTVFSLAKEFGVSQDEFYIANPSIQKDGLQEGSYIKIPKKGKNKGIIQDGHIEHTVKHGETIFSITKLYQVSFSELLKHNPDLSEGLKAGMMLKIPLGSDVSIVKTDKIKRINDNEINIGLILPLHLNNPQGSAQEKNIATDMLIGAKVALEELAFQGKKINLTVMDSDSHSNAIEKLIQENDFSKFDAVIGPLFASNFTALANILDGSGIALVSPLSNADNLRNLDNVLIATPTDEMVADLIVDEIKKEYKGQQIQILTDDKHMALAEYTQAELKKKIGGADIFITKDAKKLSQPSESLDETMPDGSTIKKEYFTPIITVLVSDNNEMGNTYLKRLKELDAENLQAYGIKFVTAYDVNVDNNKANYTALENIGFAFSTIRLVNIYGQKERNVLENFLNRYCNMPNEYQQIGYDVVFDLVDRMNSKGDVLNNLSASKTRLATKFNYKKEGRAYINQGVRIIRIVAPDEPETTEPIKD